ncbi:SDR family oxidoreductase [Kribbella qitaiheensis]|uniref:SDR family oxidoreductase n=1 Tax=Kribbella qitaiheensis TaxID=1544730 RepID=UPI0019D5CEC9|nr:SDR family oxidoreductase [Kribbella qitaiheensis]
MLVTERAVQAALPQSGRLHQVVHRGRRVPTTLEYFGGKLDILVNNAAADQAYPQGATSIPDEAWLASLNINYLSAVRVTDRFLPALIEAKGAIVNLSSTVTLDNVPALAHYAGAKAALEKYSQTLAAELAPQGVRLNVVIPGNVTTPGADKIRQDLADAAGIPVEAITDGTPLGRKGIPTDIAEAVGFLASGQAEWITGTTLLVEGGASVGLVA